MSIRLRLTLLYTLILVLTVAAFGAVLYVNQGRATLELEKEALVRTAHRITRSPVIVLNREVPDPPGAFGDFYTQVWGPDGHTAIFRDTPGNVLLPLSSEALASVETPDVFTETVTVEGQRVLVGVLPLVVRGQLGAILEVGRPLVVRDQSMAALGRWLLFGGLVAAALAAGMGWAMAGAALRPIHELADTARTIGAERDFSRRVDHAGPNDEIGELATTFNTMLDELEAGHQQVEHALDLQRRFVADVSHELRTPLTTLHGNIELLRRDPPIGPEDREEVLSDMASESQRLIRLVNDLLVLARADARRTPQPGPVTVNPIVEEAVRQARLLDPKRTIELGASPTVTARGDVDTLKQVLLIVLDNALKHTDGDVLVEVEETPGNVAIRVRDSGPGIEPSLLPHIFERFSRGQGATREPGSGLGLAIASALMESQGGTIAVQSEPHKGSCFTLSLPLETR